ncbi:MAG: hypothetical protein FWH47_03795 [Methanomassiliicoccaceae archaeon]|nr:hypothetical protein [Methanomassiliicoccaceae archaeon]
MEEIVEFLRKNVNGKTLYTDELTYQLEGGTLIGNYSDQISFSNMYFSKVRFTMDMFVVSKEQIRDAATGGEVKRYDASSLYRYCLAERRSTGDVTGVMTFVASSLLSDPVPPDSTVSGIYDMRLEGKELGWVDDQMLYRDQITSDGSFKPVAFKAKCRFYISKGRLVYEHRVECFDVDPGTMRRSLSDARYPPFVSKERRV